jgi:hypothetical protein
MSDKETVDLVVRLTREEAESGITPPVTEHMNAAHARFAEVLLEAVESRKREKRDATSYTNGLDEFHLLEDVGDHSRVLVGVKTNDGYQCTIVPHDGILSVVNAARERDGLPRLVEEGDGEPEPEACGRLLISQDGHSLDPVCGKNVGHAGVCVLFAMMTGAANAATSTATKRRFATDAALSDRSRGR